jgi:hypothetical protein
MPLRHARGLAWQVMGGEGVVLDLERGRSLGLNATAALVFSLLETHGEDEIAAELARRFEVDPEQARLDVRSFLALLRGRGLVVEA